MTFQVGDKAYVPNHGVGIVKEIKSVEVEGDTYQMYIIKILDNGLTYSVPLAQVGASGIREVIPPASVEKVYDVLRDKETPADKQTWNRRYREYMNKIKTGDPFVVAAVLRELARLKSEKTLSFGERKMYDQAHSLIVQEIAVARDVDASRSSRTRSRPSSPADRRPSSAGRVAWRAPSG
ncbi:MAG: CarD family transcriptional regulator [Myxococcota bacterium]